MRIGMLWFDSDHDLDLTVRIERAATFYRNKYGQTPNMCLINPATINTDSITFVSGLEVRQSVSVQPDHFWLGVEDSPKKSADAVRAVA